MFLLLHTITNYVLFMFNLRRGVHEICVALEFFPAKNANSLPTFRDKHSVPTSRVKQSSLTAGRLNIGPNGCPETSVQNYRSMPRKIQNSTGLIYVLSVYDDILQRFPM